MKTQEFDKAYNVTIKLIDGNIKNLRYPQVWIPGIIDTFSHYGIEVTSLTIDAFKHAVEDFLGKEFSCEPTFVNEEAYNYWDTLSVDTYSVPIKNIFE